MGCGGFFVEVVSGWLMLCWIFSNVFRSLEYPKKTGVGVFVGRGKNCGHPRQHMDGFKGFSVIPIRPKIIKMKSFRFSESES